MYNLIALGGFVTLLWIAITLARIYSTIETVRRENAIESGYPDIEHPAFSRDLIGDAYARLDVALRESLAAERELFTTPGWKAITSGERPPDQAEAGLMHDSAFATWRWEFALRRCQFLLEANLRVKRGEWTITQAQYYNREIDLSWWGYYPEVKKIETDWSGRFRDKDLAEALEREYKERTAPFENERAEFMQKWLAQFKAMHQSKPIYGSDEVNA